MQKQILIAFNSVHSKYFRLGLQYSTDKIVYFMYLFVFSFIVPSEMIKLQT